jgi:hypothetical protein
VARIVLSFAVFLSFVLSLSAQNAQPPAQQDTTAPVATQDPQAVSVLNQALAVAGGTVAIQAVLDYTAAGNITYNSNPLAQGSATILGLGLDKFRLDASLPSGVRSRIISQGVTDIVAENGTVSEYPPPYPVPSSDASPYEAPMFPGSLLLPAQQLAAILNDPRYRISYKGLVQLNGQSVHDVEFQLAIPGQIDQMHEYHVRHLFIASATLQVVMIQELVPKHVIRQVQYSAYQSAEGVLIPFTISELVGGQQAWTIALTQITFNTGLQDSAFETK